MYLQLLTFVHVMISLVGIASGFGATAGHLSGNLFPRWTAWHLATTILTSLTGFLFPLTGLTPGVILGILSLLILGPATYALYFRRLEGHWKTVFIVGSVGSLYLNFFVLVVQLFQKMLVLKELNEQTSPIPFVVTQLLLLGTFVALGYVANRNLRSLA